MFDAFAIEHSFSKLLKVSKAARGTAYDADVFRIGKPSDLSKVLGLAVNALTKRFEALGLSDEKMKAGAPGARLKSAILSLNEIQSEYTNSKNFTPNDIHWSIIGTLVGIIAALFELLEK